MNVVKKLHSIGAERSQVVPFLLPTSPTAQLSDWNYGDDLLDPFNQNSIRPNESPVKGLSKVSP